VVRDLVQVVFARNMMGIGRTVQRSGDGWASVRISALESATERLEPQDRRLQSFVAHDATEGAIVGSYEDPVRDDGGKTRCMGGPSVRAYVAPEQDDAQRSNAISRAAAPTSITR